MTAKDAGITCAVMCALTIAISSATGVLFVGIMALMALSSVYALNREPPTWWKGFVFPIAVGVTVAGSTACYDHFFNNERFRKLSPTELFFILGIIFGSSGIAIGMVAVGIAAAAKTDRYRPMALSISYVIFVAVLTTLNLPHPHDAQPTAIRVAPAPIPEPAEEDAEKAQLP